jgi:hypothetical protein
MISPDDGERLKNLFSQLPREKSMLSYGPLAFSRHQVAPALAGIGIRGL